MVLELDSKAPWLKNYGEVKFHLDYPETTMSGAVLETAKKLKDFLDSCDKVDEAYKSALLAHCSAVLIDYAQKHNT